MPSTHQVTKEQRAEEERRKAIALEAEQEIREAAKAKAENEKREAEEKAQQERCANARARL